MNAEKNDIKTFLFLFLHKIAFLGFAAEIILLCTEQQQ
jgi:hypothetical protein